MKQETFVFSLAAAGLALLVHNKFVALTTDELPDARCNAGFPPSISEILDRLAVVSISMLDFPAFHIFNTRA